MTTIVNLNTLTTNELADGELDRVSGGVSDFINVIADTVRNTVNEKLIQKAGNGFSKSLG